MKLGISLLSVLGALSVAASPHIDGDPVTAVQSGSRVEISYRLVGGPAVITFEMQTNVAEGVWASIAPELTTNATGAVNVLVQPDAVRSQKIFWKPNKTWPDRDFGPGRIRAVVTAWATNCPPDYMVVDLADSAAPVRYYASLKSIPGGLGDPLYKTDRLVLRKVHAGGMTYEMGAPLSEPNHGGYHGYGEGLHRVGFANDFYLGVYEFTAGQYKNMTGASALEGPFAELDDAAFIPIAKKAWCHWRGQPTYAELKTRIPSGGVLADFARKYGVRVDFPSFAEWQYACHAGEIGPYNRPDVSFGECAWYEDNSTDPKTGARHAWPVGRKVPNNWGFYDMHGNVAEMLIDRGVLTKYYVSDRADVDTPEHPYNANLPIQIDPVFGSDSDETTEHVMFIGGHYVDGQNLCRPSAHYYNDNNALDYEPPYVGVRLWAPAVAAR